MKLGKCKQALADLINANGGWVDGEAIFAAMDGNGDLFGYSGRPQWTVSHGHWYGHTLTCWFFSPIVINNHHQTILSREEYYQAYPKADDGWIEWNGFHIAPVKNGVEADIKFRDGEVATVFNPAFMRWSHHDSPSDIMAYRLHKPVVKPEFCESVTRSIPEPEAKPTIEQLAADYRNAKGYADRKQDEADKASMESDAALSQLEDAIAAIGFVITPLAATEKEPELVITDWRDLRVGDEVECVESNIKRDKYNGTVGRLRTIDESDTSTPYLVDFGGDAKIWCHEVKFIRRP